MPQMMPMSWMIMMMFIFFILMILISMIYFITLNTKKFMNKNKMKNFFNWNWLW